jgi:predicted N-formylglutamate amidohydrolase
MSEAYELYQRGRGGPFLFTCEHASPRIPSPLRSGPGDREWLATHWGLDIGAATVTRELVRRTRSPAVLARFSRLVCDANRPSDSPDWIRFEVEGHELGFNRRVDARERKRRQRRFHDPYHAAIDRLVRSSKSKAEPVLVAVHSFTPVLGRERRTMELGVLFNEHVRLGQRLARLFAQDGWQVVENAPYSGKVPGMIYSIERHGQAHGVPHLELELRQDLIDTAPRARIVGRRLAAALLALVDD